MNRVSITRIATAAGALLAVAAIGATTPSAIADNGAKTHIKISKLKPGGAKGKVTSGSKGCLAGAR